MLSIISHIFLSYTKSSCMLLFLQELSSNNFFQVHHGPLVKTIRSMTVTVTAPSPPTQSGWRGCQNSGYWIFTKRWRQRGRSYPMPSKPPSRGNVQTSSPRWGWGGRGRGRRRTGKRPSAHGPMRRWRRDWGRKNGRLGANPNGSTGRKRRRGKAVTLLLMTSTSAPSEAPHLYR